MIRFILMLQVVLVALVPVEPGAEIFGLKRGMSLREIRALKFGEMEKVKAGDAHDIWMVKKPRVPKGTDNVYFLIAPDKGLLKVVFYWVIETNSFGDAVKSKFRELKGVLSAKYGEGETYDYLKSGSIWKRPQDWMMGLLEKERTLIWTSDNPSKNELETILLEAIGYKTKTAELSLGYEFQGWSEHIRAEEKKKHHNFSPAKARQSLQIDGLFCCTRDARAINRTTLSIFLRHDLSLLALRVPRQRSEQLLICRGRR